MWDINEYAAIPPTAPAPKLIALLRKLLFLLEASIKSAFSLRLKNLTVDCSCFHNQNRHYHGCRRMIHRNYQNLSNLHCQKCHLWILRQTCLHLFHLRNHRLVQNLWPVYSTEIELKTKRKDLARQQAIKKGSNYMKEG